MSILQDRIIKEHESRITELEEKLAKLLTEKVATNGKNDRKRASSPR